MVPKGLKLDKYNAGTLKINHSIVDITVSNLANKLDALRSGKELKDHQMESLAKQMLRINSKSGKDIELH